jgi:hypothetical protein
MTLLIEPRFYHRGLEQIRPVTVLASGFAFDIEGAGFDQAYWNDGSGNFQSMLARLQELDGKKGILNQVRDILIAIKAASFGFRGCVLGKVTSQERRPEKLHCHKNVVVPCQN